jgi:small subunit ribosomal protein S6
MAATTALRPYEIVVIVDSGLDDQVINTTVERSAAAVKSTGGSVARIERWGRRKLAFEINKKKDGYYAVLDTMAAPDQVAEIERQLHLIDGLIRHKVVKVPPQAKNRNLAAPPTLDEISAAARERGEKD